MLKPLSFALAVVSACSFPILDTAQAGVAMSAGEIGDVASPSNVEKAQFLPFIFGGRNYCWYDSGWRGPGWYWCGYAFLSGYGWGGGYGWNGWGGRAQYRRGFRGHGRGAAVIGGTHRSATRVGGMHMGGMHMGGMHMGGMHGGGMRMGGMHMGGMHGGGMRMGGGGHGGGHGGGGRKP
jgi:hypothetical protein